MTFRPGNVKMIGMGICCLILFLSFVVVSAPPISALPESDDFVVTINPSRTEVPWGGSEQLGISFRFTGDFIDDNGNYAVDILTMAPHSYSGANGISLGGGWNPGRDLYIAYEGDTSVVFSVIYSVYLSPDYNSTEEQRLDITFICYWRDGDSSSTFYKTVSIYIIPVPQQMWSVMSYSPDRVTMTDNENEHIYLSIRNNSNYSLDFEIFPNVLNPGFNVTPASASITVSPGSTYQWTTTLTCTGYGLKRDNLYTAVGFKILDVRNAIYRQGGYTFVTYTGIEPENAANLDMRWYPETLEIPFGAWDNAYLVVTNLGPGSVSITKITVEGFVRDPVWTWAWDNPTAPVTLGEDENLTIWFSFWAHGDVIAMQKQTTFQARIEDNLGGKVVGQIAIRAVVGNFEVDAEPRMLTVQRGQVGKVYITIKNNENANRSYLIYANEEVTHNITWAASNPSIENVSLTPFASRRTEIEVTAYGSHGTYPYAYYVTCEQTEELQRAEININIVDIPTGTYKMTFGEFLEYFVPLTGSLENAAFICGFIVVIALVMVGAAMAGKDSDDRGTITMLMVVIGISMVTIFGWFPSWIMGLTVLMIALGMAQWLHGRFK